MPQAKWRGAFISQPLVPGSRRLIAVRTAVLTLGLASRSKLLRQPIRPVRPKLQPQQWRKRAGLCSARSVLPQWLASAPAVRPAVRKPERRKSAPAGVRGTQQFHGLFGESRRIHARVADGQMIKPQQGSASKARLLLSRILQKSCWSSFRSPSLSFAVPRPSRFSSYKRTNAGAHSRG